MIDSPCAPVNTDGGVVTSSTTEELYGQPWRKTVLSRDGVPFWTWTRLMYPPDTSESIDSVLPTWFEAPVELPSNEFDLDG